MADNRNAVTFPRGFTAGAVACGIKEGTDRLDLGILMTPAPAVAAGVFTQNRAAAAPVLLSKGRCASTRASAVVVNSGNANACTGLHGMDDATAMAVAVESRFGLGHGDALVLSTGVIGVRLPVQKVVDGIGQVELHDDGGERFARAILTTDTRVKERTDQIETEGGHLRLGGCAKGAGMIHPNMATLLGILTTDAAVQPAFLRDSLAEAVDRTFNMISVDGDTSTNDAVIILANGAAGGPVLTPSSIGAKDFMRSLSQLCEDLAKDIVMDAEGARTLIEVRISGAATQGDARAAARAIASSTLVKTAVFGGDPNWGRVLCAAGYSSASFSPEAATLSLNDLCLFRRGEAQVYSRDAAASLLRLPLVTFTLDLGEGDQSAVGWGCDLGYEYVRINAEYTT